MAVSSSAAEIVDKVFVGSAPWSELFAPHDFFSKYRYYLQITASSGSADVQLKWYVSPPLQSSRSSSTSALAGADFLLATPTTPPCVTYYSASYSPSLILAQVRNGRVSRSSARHEARVRRHPGPGAPLRQGLR